jgi:hypothetical protein
MSMQPRIEVVGEERMLHRNADRAIVLTLVCTRTTQQVSGVKDGRDRGAGR